MPTTAAELAVAVGQIRSGKFPALATLIAPDLAVTGAQAVDGVPEVALFSSLWTPPERRAKVAATDVKRGFALLRLENLENEVAPVEPAPLTTVVPPPGTPWTSPAPAESGFVTYDGVVGKKTVLRGRPLVQVQVKSPTPEILIGTPLIVNGQVAAVVTVLDDGNVYATTVESMATSARVPDVGNLLPLNEAELFARLSGSSRDALGVAVQLSREPDRRVHMHHVILGLYAKKEGPTWRLVGASPIGDFAGLRRILGKAVDAGIPDLPDAAPQPTAMPVLSDHVRAALRAARTIARAHGGDDIIHTRHLLYGALSIQECSVIKPLIDAGLDKNRIELRKRDLPRKSGIAGYRSDAVAGPDLLDIKRDVESLCMVLAAKDVDPPLSLGLFGEWGSGKSFFMGAMEAWFKALAVNPENTLPDSPYCRRIVQLKFNAWHYSDTNLWATLASAILQGLAEVLAEKDDPDSHYARASLETQKVQKAAELVTAEQDAVKLQADVRAADERLDRLGAGAIVRETLQAAATAPELQEKLNKATTEAGITPAVDAVVHLQRQLLEAKSVWDTLMVVGRGTHGRTLFVLSVASIVLVVLGIVAIRWATDFGLFAGLASATPFVLGLAEALRRATAPARRALTLIDEVRSRAEAKLEGERDALQLKAEAAQKKADDARSAIQTIDTKLERLRPDRRMRDFIMQRSVSPDYLAQLGTISHARRDFEQLTVLLAKVKDMADKGGGSDAPILPQIDRIILYVDDLDRCPEEKVVQVLQAVHMLLAFKLFIVVVGVDPRWLLHSLRQHSKVFQDGDETGPDVPGTDRDRVHWRSTPLNYLEKIFQIPFTLRPMGESGFNNLIDDLTKRHRLPEPETPGTADEETEQPRPPEVKDVPSRGQPPTPGGSGDSQPGLPQPSQTPVQTPVQTPAPAAGAAIATPEGVRVVMDPKLLRFESFERECMKQLRHLIPSPRAAKRFVNVYRLLRNRLAEEPWSNLLHDVERGAYRPVLVLFAMVTGYPEEASEVLEAILDGRLDGDTGQVERGFWELIDELEHRNTDAAEIRPDVAEGWKEMGDKLRRVRQLVPEDCAISEVRPYAAAVARYSFQSSRLLIDVDATDESGGLPTSKLVARAV